MNMIYVIVDFRPDNSKPQMKDYGVSVWYVLYSADYKKLTIKRRETMVDLTFHLRARSFYNNAMSDKNL